MRFTSIEVAVIRITISELHQTQPLWSMIHNLSNINIPCFPVRQLRNARYPSLTKYTKQALFPGQRQLSHSFIQVIHPSSIICQIHALTRWVCHLAFNPHIIEELALEDSAISPSHDSVTVLEIVTELAFID